MKKLLEQSRYIVLIPVLTLLIAAVATALYGAMETYLLISHALHSTVFPDTFAISMIKLMDTFLISVVLFIFAIALYELFIEDLNLPPWLIINNLYDLKNKLGGVIILVMAVNFLNHFVEWQQTAALLQAAIALMVVSATLIAFNYFESKRHD